MHIVYTHSQFIDGVRILKFIGHYIGRLREHTTVSVPYIELVIQIGTEVTHT